jgi:hypothetical protein
MIHGGQMNSNKVEFSTGIQEEQFEKCAVANYTKS